LKISKGVLVAAAPLIETTLVGRIKVVTVLGVVAAGVAVGRDDRVAIGVDLGGEELRTPGYVTTKEKLQCKTCGKESSSENKFCPKCGTFLE
jgi:tRNA(Ile2) C34 agmatinyltransferase TiaS